MQSVSKEVEENKYYFFQGKIVRHIEKTALQVST